MRQKDFTYANYYDDFNWHMSRAQFKKWFKDIGAPVEYNFEYDTSGGFAYNERAMTETKLTWYSFSIITPSVKRCIVNKTHRSHDDKISDKLNADYDRWAKQVISES